MPSAPKLGRTAAIAEGTAPGIASGKGVGDAAFGGDGIVNWRTTLQEEGHDLTQSIRVRGSHCGMTLNPAIWYLVAECLAHDSDSWEPFRRESWRALLYPEASMVNA